MPDSVITIEAVFEPVPANTPNLSLLPVTFTDVTFGYTQPAAKTVTIENTGDTAATVTITVSDATSSFTFGDYSSITTIAAYSEETFTVQPKAGLNAGIHTAVITATYTSGVVTTPITATANLSFTVEKDTPNAATVTANYDISNNLIQTANNITAVTVTPKTGAGAGAVTAIYYEGAGGTTHAKSTTRPTTAGKYLVTFNVAEATNWNAASDLPAGTLTITLATLTGNVSITNTGTIYVGTALNASYTGGSESVTYTWHKDGAATAIATGATYTPTEAGTYTVTVSATGYASKSASVTVNAITLSSITITGPTKTTYTIGETYSTNGLVVTAHYNNGTTAPIASGFTLTPETVSTASAGNHTVTVTYQGHTATFTVMVSTYALAIPPGATVIYVANSVGGGGEPTSVLWTTAVLTVNGASSGANFAIIVVQDISIAGTTSETFTKANLNLYLAGQTGNETIELTGTGRLLYIGAGQSVTLDGLTLQGNPSNNVSFVTINGASGTGTAAFTMNSGTITGNIGGNSSGGGVFVFQGAFTMKGGSITGNTASDGGGVRLSNDSTFIMSGGSITDNTASGSAGSSSGSGGGVNLYGSSAVFTMTGGVISGNKALGSGSNNGGGGVDATGGSSFRISNGTIYGNEASVAEALRNTASQGAALYTEGTAEHGTFADPSNVNSPWTSKGNLSTTNNTIRVENGDLQ